MYTGVTKVSAAMAEVQVSVVNGNHGLLGVRAGMVTHNKALGCHDCTGRKRMLLLSQAVQHAHSNIIQLSITVQPGYVPPKTL